MKYVQKQQLNPVEKRIKKEIKNFLMKELEKNPYVDFGLLSYGKYTFSDRGEDGIKAQLKGTPLWEDSFCVINNKKIRDLLKKRDLRRFLEGLPDGGKSITREDKLKKLLNL